MAAPSTRSAWLIVNPAAGSLAAGGSSVADVVERLSGAGWQLEVKETETGDSARKLARDAADAGVPFVIVAGGDGTVGVVAAELTGSATVLGIIPLGTFNNVARSVGIPADVDAACEILAHGAPRKIDVGEAAGRRIFFEAAGVGLDAALFPLGEQVKDGQWTRWWDIAQRTLDYPVQRFTLTLHGTPHGKTRVLRRHALLVVVANGPYYGGGFTVAPGARLSDGMLTVSVYRNFSKLELLRHFFSVRRGRHRHSRKIETFRAHGVTVWSRGSVSVHADGDPIGKTPVTFRTLRGALQILAPDESTLAAERAAAARETEEAIAASFAEVRSRKDAAATLDKLADSETKTDADVPAKRPAEQSAAIAGSVASARDEDKAAAALAETAVQLAEGSDPAPIDEAVASAARKPDTPEVRRGRRLLREELLSRLKPLDAADAALFLQINHLPHPGWVNRFFATLSRVMTGGQAWILPLVAASLQSGKPPLAVTRRVMPPLWAATFLVEMPVKHYFKRRRPFAEMVRAIVVGRKPGSYSFPSGHTAAAFAGAVLLSKEFPKQRGIWFSLASLVGFSRIYLGAHYPGDVLSGGLLGVLLVRLFARIFGRKS